MYSTLRSLDPFYGRSKSGLTNERREELHHQNNPLLSLVSSKCYIHKNFLPRNLAFDQFTKSSPSKSFPVYYSTSLHKTKHTKPQTTDCLELWSAERQVLVCRVLVCCENGLGGPATQHYMNTLMLFTSQCPAVHTSEVA